MEFFVLINAIIFFILCLREAEWTLMLLLAGLPLYLIRFKVFDIPSTVLEVMILMSFFAWLFLHTELRNFIKGKYKIKDYLNNRKKRLKYPFAREIGALLLISFFAVLIAGFSNASLGIWKAYFFEPILVFILVLNIFKPSFEKNQSPTGQVQSMQKIYWPLFLSSLAVSVIAILQITGLIYSPEEFWPRATGPWPYPNALGLFVGPLIPLMVSYLIFLIREYKARVLGDGKKILKKKLLIIVILIFITIVSIISIFSARSEGVVIGVIVGLIFIGSYAIGKKQKAIINIARSGVFAILVFVIFSSVFFLKFIPEHKYINSSYNTINYITDKLLLKDFSGEVRKQQWRETFNIMKEDWHWLFGAGLSQYQISVKPVHQEGIFFNKDRDTDFRRKIVWFDEKFKVEHWRPVEIYMYPHNIILNFWSELGLAGVLLFAWIIGKYFYTGFKNLKGSENNNQGFITVGLIGAMLVIIIHGIVDVPYFKNDLSVMFWVLIALMSIMNLGEAQ